MVGGSLWLIPEDEFTRQVYCWVKEERSGSRHKVLQSPPEPGAHLLRPVPESVCVPKPFAISGLAVIPLAYVSVITEKVLFLFYCELFDY